MESFPRPVRAIGVAFRRVITLITTCPKRLGVGGIGHDTRYIITLIKEMLNKLANGIHPLPGGLVVAVALPDSTPKK
jgi:hypothetical protein